jgi:hypothetical protein
MAPIANSHTTAVVRRRACLPTAEYSLPQRLNAPENVSSEPWGGK